MVRSPFQAARCTQKGDCSEVVVRALREGLGLDLQLAVYRDRSVPSPPTPRSGRSPGPIRHIDHHRPPVSIDPAASPTGNLACGRLPGNRPQIGFTAAFRRGHTTRRPVLPVRDRRSFPAERRGTGLARPSLPPEAATPGRLVPLPRPSPFILAQIPRGVRGAGPPADRSARCAGRNLRDRTCQ
jgi:hypothetical protein